MKKKFENESKSKYELKAYSSAALFTHEDGTRKIAYLNPETPKKFQDMLKAWEEGKISTWELFR